MNALPVSFPSYTLFLVPWFHVMLVIVVRVLARNAGPLGLFASLWFKGMFKIQGRSGSVSGYGMCLLTGLSGAGIYLAALRCLKQERLRALVEIAL